MSMYEPAKIPDNTSAQLQVVLKWTEAAGRCDIDGLSSMLAEEFEHHLLPRTMANVAPTRSGFEFLRLLRETSTIMEGMPKLTIHEITECPGRVVLHATSNGMSTTGQPYTNEYIMTFLLKQRADGQYEIVALKEFVDSKFTLEFFAAEGQRQAAAKDTGAEATK